MKIAYEIIKISDLENQNTVLDYDCGEKILQNNKYEKKYILYDWYILWTILLNENLNSIYFGLIKKLSFEE